MGASVVAFEVVEDFPDCSWPADEGVHQATVPLSPSDLAGWTVLLDSSAGCDDDGMVSSASQIDNCECWASKMRASIGGNPKSATMPARGGVLAPPLARTKCSLPTKVVKEDGLLVEAEVNPMPDLVDPRLPFRKTPRRKRR